MTISESKAPRSQRRVVHRRLPFHDGGVPLGGDDYLALPEDGTDSEIIFGVLDVGPRPIALHQRIVFELASAIAVLASERGIGGVILDSDLMLETQHTYVSPDLMYFTHDQYRQLDLTRRIVEAPTLVIEVLSPSSTTRDRVHKRQAYARAEIPHYWLVDPAKRRIEELVLGVDAIYRDAPRDLAAATFESAIFPGLAIDLAKLFR